MSRHNLDVDLPAGRVTCSCGRWGMNATVNDPVDQEALRKRFEDRHAQHVALEPTGPKRAGCDGTC